MPRPPKEAQDPGTDLTLTRLTLIAEMPVPDRPRYPVRGVLAYHKQTPAQAWAWFRLTRGTLLVAIHNENYTSTWFPTHAAGLAAVDDHRAKQRKETP
jgi:hypothetical protein